MNFRMNHAPSAGLITQPVDLQSSALPLCYGCPSTDMLLSIILSKLCSIASLPNHKVTLPQAQEQYKMGKLVSKIIKHNHINYRVWGSIPSSDHS